MKKASRRYKGPQENKKMNIEKTFTICSSQINFYFSKKTIFKYFYSAEKQKKHKLNKAKQDGESTEDREGTES